MIPNSLQKVKSYDSETEIPIYKKIKQIQDLKASMMLQITSHFDEVKKKLIKSLEKAQKYLQQKLNEACLDSLDSLRKIAQIVQMAPLDEVIYIRKAERVIKSLEKISLDQTLINFTDKFKIYVEELKKQKQSVFNTFPQFNIEKSLIEFEKKIKVEGDETIDKLVEINGKILKIGGCLAYIDKHTLNKKIDFAIAIKIGKNKENEQKDKKSKLLILHDQQLTIYNDKLVMHSLKKFEYSTESEIKGAQLGRYLFIASRHKITRINLNNMDEMYVKTINQEITAICPKKYEEGLLIACNQKVQLCDPNTLEVLFGFDCKSMVHSINIVGNYIVCLTENSMQIFENFNSHSLFSKQGVNPFKIIPLTEKQFILVSKQSHFMIYYLEERSDFDDKSYEMLNGSISNKMIKDVGVGGSTISCLSTGGRHIFLYTF